MLRCSRLLRSCRCISLVAVVVGTPTSEPLLVVSHRCCCVDAIGVLRDIVYALGRASICMLVLAPPVMFVHHSLLMLLVVRLVLLWFQLPSSGLLVV